MLNTERAIYEERCQEFLREYPGQFVLIVGVEFCGAFPSEQAAYAAGIERFGRQDMLIRRAMSEEEPVLAVPALHVGLNDARTS